MKPGQHAQSRYEARHPMFILVIVFPEPQPGLSPAVYVLDYGNPLDLTEPGAGRVTLNFASISTDAGPSQILV